MGTHGDNWHLALDFIKSNAPAKVSDLNDYMADVLTEKAVSVMLSNMIKEGAIIRLGTGLYGIPNGNAPQQPANGHKPAMNAADLDARSVNGKVDLSLADRQRQAFQVEIYTAVIVEPRVTAIKVRYEGLGNYVKLPLWGAVRICLGPDDPGWTEEWSNRGVTDIQMVRPDGSTREFTRLDPSNTVSIAPLRD